MSMNTRELLEMACMDALGLLDEDERRRFDAGFDASPAEVRAQLRKEQARFAEIERLLPDVRPPAEMRRRVLEAISHESLAPVGRITPAGSGRRLLRFTLGAAVSPLWRATAIGCAAAAVSFGVLSFWMQAEYRRLNGLIQTNTVADFMSREFGLRFEETLVSGKTQFVRFGAQPGAPTGACAVLLHNPDSGSSYLYCKNLPSDNGPYDLVAIDAAGKAVRTLASFTIDGGKLAKEIRGLSLESGLALAIIPAGPRGTGTPVLRSI